MVALFLLTVPGTLHIFISAPKEDFGKVDGLCGNYNGHMQDDIDPQLTDNQYPPDHSYTNKYRLVFVSILCRVSFIINSFTCYMEYFFLHLHRSVLSIPVAL